MATLYMLLVGCKPSGRNTEQHDIYFGIGDTVKDLIPDLLNFWPGAAGKLHIDAWRRVTCVDGFRVTIVPNESITKSNAHRLFFINLGGYKPGEFEEFHYKMLIAAGNKGSAIQQSKKTAFYLHTGFDGASSHIDDKYGIDVDDFYEIEDLLSSEDKKSYQINVTPGTGELPDDEIHLGYFKLNSFQ